MSEKNFHRSLDHRSFIFKRHDKKFTQAARFEKEPEFRSKLIMKYDYSANRLQRRILATEGKKEEGEVEIEKHQTARAAKTTATAASDNAMEFETDVQQFYTTFLNTFQGTTTNEKCLHETAVPPLAHTDIEHVKLKSSLPVMIFSLEDRAIVEDTFSLLMFYLQFATLNASER